MSQSSFAHMRRYHWETAEDQSRIGGWLRRIALNVVIDAYRRRQIRPVEVDFPEALPHDFPVSGDFSDFADRTTTSAAENLGIPVGTVERRLGRALTSLRGALTSARRR